MKAVRLVKPGSPLELYDVETPTPGADDVLVRVKAAGICHSDAHYRSGRLSADPLPVTLGHEVAGIAERVGREVTAIEPGDHVCLHYMATCGQCEYCSRGIEQFCTSGQMLGKDRDGGYAEFICVPERSTFRMPGELPFEQGAVLMCSSATSLHALNKARLNPGETVAVWGVGGLGVSAVQLARACGAGPVYAVDLKKNKLDKAAGLGAIPVDASSCDPAEEIMKQTRGRGVDVVLELLGLPETMEQALASLAVGGRIAVAGLGGRTFKLDPYRQLLGREAEIIGVSDHLASEIPPLLEWARQGTLDLEGVVTKTVDLDPREINDVLDDLEHFSEEVRVVIRP
jgi:propanol-preferring alcohol dehydrogenase